MTRRRTAPRPTETEAEVEELLNEALTSGERAATIETIRQLFERDRPNRPRLLRPTRTRIVPAEEVRSSSQDEPWTFGSAFDEDAPVGENKVSRKGTKRKLAGFICICVRAMSGRCPLLIQRAKLREDYIAEEEEGESEFDGSDLPFCEHMVPHSHKGEGCSDPYDRVDGIPRPYAFYPSCKEAACLEMAPLPEHKRWGANREKMKSKNKGELPNHRRMLIL